MLKPLEVDLKRSITDKLKLSFDDKVQSVSLGNPINQTELLLADHVSSQLWQETAGVTFRVEGKPIHAHRLILKLSHDYFRRMFDNDWKENAK